MNTVVKSTISTLPLPASAHRESPLPVPAILTVSVLLAQPGTVVLTARGDVDMSSAPYLRERVQEQIHHAGPDLVLDLTAVVFFSGAGLTVLTHVSAAAIAAGVGFRLVTGKRAVLMPLRLSGLDALIDVHPDLDSVPMRPWLPVSRSRADSGDDMTTCGRRGLDDGGADGR